jgi:hypothetical protein
MELGNFPAVQCSSREDWLRECRKYYEKFETLRQFDAVAWAQVHYIRTENGHPIGCCIICRDSDNNWYAGASYCDARDRHRFTKDESRARALASFRKLEGPVDLSKPANEVPFLLNFAPSCRLCLQSMLLGRPDGTHQAAVADSQVAG